MASVDRSEQDNTVTLIRITFQDPETNATADVVLDPTVFVALVHLMRTCGQGHTETLLTFAASLVKPELTGLDHLRLQHTLTAVERFIAQWPDPAELALAISYEQLRDQRLTDAQAATFAAALLDRRITAAVWRKRVDRWAEQQALPAIAPGASAA